ncbi:hypothetical protein OU787_14090 [Kitasatospora sp. YST-16]|uniref:hypothetical protein n=1 Tax=Kitasatospora sp. YST-16 TaxID=2998080 RepID=UPI0022848D57|nr:hypothetical protein [Kitasatospora sp. YST-16]WAL72537.1 hypothetical protein OU787_14090 [Kitasatospora sp. YST-16]
MVRQPAPRTHWLLLTALVVTLAAALLLQGYTRHMYGSAPDGAARATGPAGAVPRRPPTAAR